MRLVNALAALLAPCHVAATAVFAHFMVGNTALFETSDWESNMKLAKEAHIDAFALNMAQGWPQNIQALNMAFQAATNTGFKLFFSFDYAGNGSWPAGEVSDLIRNYGSRATYFQYYGKPFVSTFEGPDRAADWVAIKKDTPCFFVPDWSSVGAGPASTAAGGVADGLFNWAAWAYGKNNMTTYIDASYLQALNGVKPYMMPVSPWFYTNLPGYHKNWAWRGDNLWYDRWQQVFNLKPEFVEIISWNDFGESHYIGPLDDRQYEAFEIGEAPFNYVKDMPHDGWRIHLPWLIDTYKNLNPTVGTESAVIWFRKSEGAHCQDGGTTGNTATQLQIEYDPSAIFQDKIFIAALLAEPAYIEWTDGRHANVITHPDGWDYIPPGGVGIYQHSIDLTSMMGQVGASEVAAQLYRTPNPYTSSGFLVPSTSVVPDDTCYLGLANWNALVAAEYSKEEGVRTEKALKLSDQACVEGFGAALFGNFNELCWFTCKYDYCPPSACVCTKMGKALTKPKETGTMGFSANGDMNYDGLCRFACVHGFCPSDVCSTSQHPVYIPDNSPFSDPACRKGVAKAEFANQYGGLCSYACNWGFCPMHVCSCTETGYLNIPPPITGPGGASDGEDDAGLCDFACKRGYCPQPCSYSVPINFIDSTCTNEWKLMLRSEMSNAYDMAVAARDHLLEGDYFNHFFSQNLRNEAKFATDITETYARIADMLSGSSANYAFSVSCDQTRPACWRKKWYASMNDGTQVMNFCAAFFNDAKLQFSGTVLNQCNSINLRDAQFTKAAVIVHEASHTYYAMRDGPPALDVAYGYTSCTNLALGLFDRSCVSYGQQKKRKDGTLSAAICPDQAGVEGLCNSDMSARNADTYSHVAAGIYFSRQCNRAIPYPQPAALAARAKTGDTAFRNESTKRQTTAAAAEAFAIVDVNERQLEPITAPKEARHPHDSRRMTRARRRPGSLAVHQSRPRADTCPYIDDFIVWDGDDENSNGITGYTHFGDSYASGMGTGTTEGSKCRVGSNNYGDLIYNFLDDKSISYERRSCSGDTTDGLYVQIDGWGNAAQASVVTLTMGGNDLNFSDLVYYCVVTPNTAQLVGALNRKWCVEAEDRARNHMEDLSDKGLRARLKDAYLRILRKTGRRDTNLYVTGYPTFFNEETADCDDSSFHYLFGGYKPPSDWPLSRIVYLTRPLRKELDDLVRQLNGVIQDAIHDANTAQGGNQVHFVDVVPAFSDGQHRWCEDGVHEPTSTRTDTWFFLSAWPDAGDPDAAAADAAELQTMFAHGPIVLPDANTCNTTLGANPDPYAVSMCNLAQTVRDAPDGPEALRFGRANADLSSGNFNSQDVPWYAPTRQIKTFHPRTSGMIAYRDAILEQIQAHGQM